GGRVADPDDDAPVTGVVDDVAEPGIARSGDQDVAAIGAGADADADSGARSQFLAALDLEGEGTDQGDRGVTRLVEAGGRRNGAVVSRTVGPGGPVVLALGGLGDTDRLADQDGVTGHGVIRNRKGEVVHVLEDLVGGHQIQPILVSAFLSSVSEDSDTLTAPAAWTADSCTGASAVSTGAGACGSACSAFRVSRIRATSSASSAISLSTSTPGA